MAANCLIYRRCRANAINKPLYHEDSFVRSLASNVHRSSVRRTNSNLPRIRKEEKIHSLARPIFFNRASIYTRCVISLRFWFLFAYIYIYTHVFPVSTLSRTSYLRHSNATREKTRRGKWNWRSEWSIPANILSLKVYKSPRIYTFRQCIFCTYLHYGRSICTKTVIREEDSLNIKRIFAAINRRVVTIGEGSRGGGGRGMRD